jgi:hypothetical protein
VCCVLQVGGWACARLGTRCHAAVQVAPDLVPGGQLPQHGHLGHVMRFEAPCGSNLLVPLTHTHTHTQTYSFKDPAKDPAHTHTHPAPPPSPAQTSC